MIWLLLFSYGHTFVEGNPEFVRPYPTMEACTAAASVADKKAEDYWSPNAPDWRDEANVFVCAVVKPVYPV